MSSKEIERPVPLAPMSPFSHIEEWEEEDDRPLSAYARSVSEQSDREVQQEHWHKD